MRANNGYMGGLPRHTRRTSHPEDIRRGADIRIVRGAIRYGEGRATGARFVVGRGCEGAGASPYEFNSIRGILITLGIVLSRAITQPI